MTDRVMELNYGYFEGSETYQRFIVDARNSNRTVYDRIRYFHYSEIYREDHFVCYTDRDKILGVLGLQNSPEVDDVVWFKFISVDPEFRGLGIGRRLLEMCVEYVQAIGKRIEMSSYTEMGRLWLKPKIEALEAELPQLFHMGSSLKL